MNMSYFSLSDVLRAAFGPDAEIAGQKRVYGGDINDAWELRLSGGQRIFMKTNQIKNARFFETEQWGLEAMRSTGAIGVPDLLEQESTGRETFPFCCLII